MHHRKDGGLRGRRARHAGDIGEIRDQADDEDDGGHDREGPRRMVCEAQQGGVQQHGDDRRDQCHDDSPADVRKGQELRVVRNQGTADEIEQRVAATTATTVPGPNSANRIPLSVRDPACVDRDEAMDDMASESTCI